MGQQNRETEGLASGHIMAAHCATVTGREGERHRDAPQHTPPAALLLTDIFARAHACTDTRTQAGRDADTHKWTEM